MYNLFCLFCWGFFVCFYLCYCIKWEYHYVGDMREYLSVGACVLLPFCRQTKGQDWINHCFFVLPFNHLLFLIYRPFSVSSVCFVENLIIRNQRSKERKSVTRSGVFCVCPGHICLDSLNRQAPQRTHWGVCPSGCTVWVHCAHRFRSA